MGLNWPELKLDLGSSGFVPKTMSEILTDVSMIDDDSVKATKLNDYVHVIQDEIRKIDPFKRELPLCMRLLSDAVERLKEERVHCTEREVQPEMTEFLPLKGNSEDDGGANWSNDGADKKNWRGSAQLWATGVQPHVKEENSGLALESSKKEADGSEIESPFEAYQISKSMNGGGAFLPFKGQPGLTLTEKNELLRAQGGPYLSAPAASISPPYLNPKGKSVSGPSFRIKSQNKPEEPLKKQRRCWSPQLHGLFVEALEKLGGPQKATPKQIKDRMEVGGLTADEIKSHLQKYRFHIRRAFPRSLSTATAPSLLPSQNYLWQTPEGLFKANSTSSSQSSGSLDGPFHLGESSKGVSITCDCISLDEEEDEKSESHGWRGLLQKPFNQGHS